MYDRSLLKMNTKQRANGVDAIGHAELGNDADKPAAPAISSMLLGKDLPREHQMARSRRDESLCAGPSRGGAPNHTILHSAYSGLGRAETRHELQCHIFFPSPFAGVRTNNRRRVGFRLGRYPTMCGMCSNEQTWFSG